MAENDLNEVIEELVVDPEVITVNIDDTLTVSGEAADAKAVGDALALKADRSELSAAITVNGQSADAQGKIIVYGDQVEMSSTDDTKVQAAIAAVDAKTGATIPVNGEQGAVSIEQAIAAAAGSSMSVTGNTLQITGDITDSSDAMSNLRVGTTALPVKDTGAVRSVNNVAPGTSGNVQISTVDAARQLVSENTQLVEGAFIRRTSGGTASIGTGDAYLGVIRGNSVHTGVVEESFTTTVTSSAQEPIAAEVTELATFREQAETGGTYTFTYSGSWDKNPASWGITVTGTPASGDVITVVWVEAERGTITPATPTAFTGSNWNLYNHTAGYARVIRYSDEYGFGISGAYTALKYSATESGTQTTITPVNGIFTVPSDGYVFVTGGNATNTAIWMQQSDWAESYDGSWKAHSEDIISLTDAMQNFPNGLCSVGDVRDEINLNTQEAQVRIERMEYSAENLADVIAAGRAYDADEDYIYAVYLDEDMPDPVDIEVDGSYAADDHGMEWFDDTDAPVDTQIIYGDNLVDKLRTDVVTKSQDIVDNLTTNDAKKVLSAKQGKALNDLLGFVFPSGHTASVAALVSKVISAGENRIVIFTTSSAVSKLFANNVGGTGYGIAKNVQGSNRVDYTMIQPSSGTITLGTINTTNNAVTVVKQFT